MNIIPIVFCFDDNLKLAAGVCLSSLLMHKLDDTFYDIFIIHDQQSVFQKENYFDCLSREFNGFRINYRQIGNEFDNAFEIRGITKAAYYRLLIPSLIPEYSKIMYHDVDVIFRSDMAAIFHATDMEGYYMAGVVSPGSLDSSVYQKRLELGLDPFQYILSGDLIIHSSLILKDGIISKFIDEAKKEYTHQDQDIINIVCKGKIKRMPPIYCGSIEAFRLQSIKKEQEIYSIQELDEMLIHGIVHYNGPKPWNSFCPNFDIWWEYYRKSVFFNAEDYFNFFLRKMDDLDRLSLTKRIKILARYFIKGVKRD